MQRKYIHTIVFISFMAVTFIACQENESINTERDSNIELQRDVEEATLRVLNIGAGLSTDEAWEDVVFNPVQSRYPQISFEVMEGGLTELEDGISAGTIPDIIFVNPHNIFRIMEMGMAADLSTFVNERNIDLSRFDPSLVEAIEGLGDGEELYGIPFGMNFGMLLYDKDIFDQLGVPYPTDNMTWNDVITVARELTVEEDNMHYVGLEPVPPLELVWASGLPHIDEMEEALFVSEEYGEEYTQVFDILQQMYNIPGATRYNDDGNPIHGNIGQFITQPDTRQVAMVDGWLAWWTTEGGNFEEATNRTNWDMVSYPQFEHRPGFGRNVDFHTMMVSPHSDHMEAVYDVVETLISEEVQVEMNRHTRITVLDDDNIRAEHASTSDLYEGKNLEGVFSLNPSPLFMHLYSPDINPYITEHAIKMSTENLDVNSALRMINEDVNIAIEEIKAAEGN